MKQEWYDNLFNELRCSALASEVQYALMSTPLGVNDTITEFFSYKVNPEPYLAING